MPDETQVNSPEQEWRNYCREAVRKFVMNAVVIDNDPVCSNSNGATETQRATAARADDGMGGEDLPKEGQPTSEVEPPPLSAPSPELNIREISDAFAELKISCGFLLPNDNDTDTDEETIFKRALASALPADIVIIDWYLRNSDPVLTTRILRGIAQEDSAEKGRLRLICVYTQTDAEPVFDLALKELEEHGLQFTDVANGNYGRGAHHSLLVLSKKDVACRDLPEKLLDVMTRLADGLLPSFALASVAAIRRNMHHIITQFPASLDAAFVANRLITDPPGDVAELMRELFVSECDTALGLSRVIDKHLEKDQIKLWLDCQNLEVGSFVYHENNRPETVPIDGPFLYSLLQNGLTNGKVNLKNIGEKNFKEEKRGDISKVLHGSEEDSTNKELAFARKVALKREFFGTTKLLSPEGWLPSLTLGTILSVQSDKVEEIGFPYLYCITPACDTLRLKNKERNFLFLGLVEHTSPSAQKKFDFVIIVDGNVRKRLYTDPRPFNVRVLRFKGSAETGRVQARKDGETGKLFFDTATDPQKNLLWLGEVRRNRANRDMAELNRAWLRFGINDSEYLRLAGKKN